VREASFLRAALDEQKAKTARVTQRLHLMHAQLVERAALGSALLEDLDGCVPHVHRSIIWRTYECPLMCRTRLLFFKQSAPRGAHATEANPGIHHVCVCVCVCVRA